MTSGAETPFGYMTLGQNNVCQPTSLCAWMDKEKKQNPIPYCDMHADTEICKNLKTNTYVVVLGCYYDNTCGGNFRPLDVRFAQATPISEQSPLVPQEVYPFSTLSPSSSSSSSSRPTIRTWWVILLIVFGGLVVLLCFYFIRAHILARQAHLYRKLP